MSDRRSWTNFERRAAAITRNVPLDDIERETSEIDESAAKVQNMRTQFNTITLEKMNT
jgi:hypothetical protein